MALAGRKKREEPASQAGSPEGQPGRHGEKQESMMGRQYIDEVIESQSIIQINRNG